MRIPVRQQSQKMARIDFRARPWLHSPSSAVAETHLAM